MSDAKPLIKMKFEGKMGGMRENKCGLRTDLCGRTFTKAVRKIRSANVDP